MKLIKSIVLMLILNLSLNAGKEALNINFKNLSIMDLIKITSKIVNKNILITKSIPGNVDFISNKPIFKDDIINILIFSLENKGYTLIDNDNMLRIIRISDSAKYNAPIFNSNKRSKYFQMITEIFKVKNTNVDYITSKIRHFLSRSAKIVTDKESNSIIVTDFKNNIKTIKNIISFVTKDKNQVLEIVELRNIKVNVAKKTLLDVAKSMFNFKVTENKINVLANKENNSVTILGSRKNVLYLKKYILNIDKKSDVVKRVVEVIQLKNAESKNVIKVINSMILKKKYIDPNNKPYASADDESNSIVLMGPNDEILYIKELITKLDKEKLQVYVKARIIEVNNDLVDDIGFKYSIFSGKKSKKGLFAFSTALNGGTSVVNTLTGFLGSLASKDISSVLALGASIDLLNKHGALDIVSEPSILCINNKESSIYVGETISIKTSSTFSDSGKENSNFKREDIGLTLKIKPRISSNNKVTLEIHTILEDVKTTTTDSGNADTSKKEVKTTAIVNNGESVIIGGLIQNKEEMTKQGVPILKSVPIFGELFKHSKSQSKKRSLVIIITPYIIPKSKDLTFVRNKLSELKILEDKYLDEALIRLKQKKIKRNIEEKINKLKLQKLNDELNYRKSKSLNKKDIYNKYTKPSNEELHRQRLKKYFGF